ncbi:IS66 family insertion sequence element accessory protein TnpB, partial [Prevotella bivia]
PLCSILALLPLPEKLMFVLNETNVFRVCCTPVDMRQGILRLSQLVRSNDFNPSDGVVYVFYNRSRNRIKLLHWERCGFVVYHKQMVQGCLSPKIILARTGFYELRWDELVLYIEGINPNCYRRKRYNKS